MKRIGIVGGISYESTLVYYELICKKYYERYRDYSYPEIVIVSLNFEKFTNFENNDRTRYIEYLVEGIKSLENAGAAFVIMAANSPHVVFDEVEKRAAVPLLSIVEVTAERAHQQGMKTLLLLGIKATMQSSVYQDVCKKHSITVIVPSPDQQDDIEKIIFEELVVGVIREESRTTICDIIMGYDVDGVILGCTELPLLVRQKDVDKGLLNTGEIHGEAALDYALV
jgi:aspartate racemase